jgi:hypothetical protein
MAQCDIQIEKTLLPMSQIYNHGSFLSKLKNPFYKYLKISFLVLHALNSASSQHW